MQPGSFRPEGLRIDSLVELIKERGEEKEEG
jgi:hypothetical protein